ncbi:leucyl aminopeptidase family protein [Nocardioides coralli]|uniref:leucyl aminopeptidase family protein n=1 Tax=Nocardioides coralli TaxID=2872154 RepID=UPI001CA3CFBB|nr:leucyl aminopeptidase family protein [Nocardioides coralli]QZY28462.1 leucyl aminopeptidase family protein [Nocardioides coralli]
MAFATDTLPAQVSPPEFALSALPPHAVSGVEVVAIPVLTGIGDGSVLLGPGAEEVGAALGVDLLDVLDAQRATGRAGEITSWPVPAGTPDNPALRQLLLVGVGGATRRDLRRAGAAVARAVRDRTSLASSVHAISDDGGLEAYVVGLTLASFSFTFRSGGPEHPPVGRVVLASSAEDKAVAAALHRGIVLGGAGWRSRMLATVPSNIKNPPWLAEQAEELAAASGLTCTVWDEHRLATEGFGGILGVGQASATPPRMVRLDYVPKGGRKAPRVVLVGKGITFDTGGLSIKPSESMATMKRDMTGGAVVMSVLAALRELGCPLRVTGLVAAAENAISGNALRPGDVIRHYGGRTTEVTNTDAEGRLVLADALAYAVDELEPAAIVDIATLTGAMKVALGIRTGGYFANHEQLARTLREAGSASDEELWRFPLVADYEAYIASEVADADNGPRKAGAISAALFLQHFVGGTPWAHLDVASVGDSPDEHHEWTTGPTGFGARVLLQWLTSDDPLAGIA